MTASTSTADVLALPQTDDTWTVSYQNIKSHLNGYWILLILDSSGRVLVTKTVGEALIRDFSSLKETIFATCVNPQLFGTETVVPGYRPKTVAFDDKTVALQMRDDMNEAQISVEILKDLSHLNEIVSHITSIMTKFPATMEPIPPITSIQGITPSLLEKILKTTQSFYDSAPWKEVDNLQTFSIKITSTNNPNLFSGIGDQYVVLMGYSGQEFGIINTPSIDQLLCLLCFTETNNNNVDTYIRTLTGDHGLHSLYFDKVTTLPFEDIHFFLNARKNWAGSAEEFFGAMIFPVPKITLNNGERKRPDLVEMQWYTCAMPAISQFVLSLKPNPKFENGNILGQFLPSKKEIFIESEMVGNVQISISYPGVKLEFCGNCSKIGNKHKRCGKCKSVWYCSTSCQKLDWPKHKKVCAPLKV